MELVFIHGWSVTHTDTYAQLPQALVKLLGDEINLTIRHIHLGRYISFDDAVRLTDIAKAFNDARLELLGEKPFAVIAHSTGGPVIRQWLQTFFSGDNFARCPLTHLIMLAPANHGSALAQLGKSRVGRIKSFFSGVEPGQGILDWLELGSDGQYDLNRYWLDNFSLNGPLPFVLTGEAIDSQFYDYLNSYTGEEGSDGVVRVASANLNFSHLLLTETAHTCEGFDKRCIAALKLSQHSIASQQTAFEVIKSASHSGSRKGIMGSVTVRNAKNKSVVQRIAQCLKVTNPQQYRQLANEMSQANSIKRKPRACMLVVRVTDDTGLPIEDFDILLLSGPKFVPGEFSKGFMLDKQKNHTNKHVLTFYFNADKLAKVREGKIGFRVEPRPNSGMCYYHSAEFQSETNQVHDLLQADQTTMVDIILNRQINPKVFSLVPPDLAGDFSQLVNN
ncbi:MULTISPECIES: triacylglycerol lipase [unclassified Shewanella]|uniref:esterase/lipase family protein n=1 Tax=unclassified Shewanella TaxID=196818 RepID=UPI001BB92FF6|nr:MULTISPECIES: alpha/beta hydrolase [unclassified Shewanella]GIU20048.1 phospholipase [Shewanella sp. MBTL60-112-B1]GIU34331.1 phospholipase [Shewanella sp. MBTL60-112-B2]